MDSGRVGRGSRRVYGQRPKIFISPSWSHHRQVTNITETMTRVPRCKWIKNWCACMSLHVTHNSYTTSLDQKRNPSPVYLLSTSALFQNWSNQILQSQYKGYVSFFFKFDTVSTVFSRDSFGSKQTP